MEITGTTFAPSGTSSAPEGTAPVSADAAPSPADNTESVVTDPAEPSVSAKSDLTLESIKKPPWRRGMRLRMFRIYRYSASRSLWTALT
jgi:hypothetical protein